MTSYDEAKLQSYMLIAATLLQAIKKLLSYHKGCGCLACFKARQCVKLVDSMVLREKPFYIFSDPA